MAFGNKQEEIERLQLELDQERQANERLTHGLQLERAVNDVAYLARTELDSSAFLGSVAEDAISMASIAVIAIERKRLTDESAATLQREHYDEYAASFRASEGPNIIANLRQVFALDGTFATIEAQAREDVNRRLQSEVLTETRTAIEARAALPEEQAKLRAELKTEIADSEEMKNYTEQVRNNYRKTWRAEVTEETIADIDTEEAASEDTFKAAEKKRLATDPDMVAYRTKARAKVMKEWTEAAKTDYLSSVQNDELEAVRAELLALEVVAQKKRLAATELLAGFLGMGVDMLKVAKGSRVEIFLGEAAMLSVVEKYLDIRNTARERNVEVPGYLCRRKLTIISLGDGRYRVDGDSLLESDDAYVRDSSMSRGTIITPGHCVKEAGEQLLEPLLSADVPLYITDHSTSPAHTRNAEYPVANIIIDDVPARATTLKMV